MNKLSETFRTPLATESPEYLSNIRQIRRISTRIQGIATAVHFNGETVHMDIFKIRFPEDWEPMWIDGKYWGDCRWRSGSDKHRSVDWRATGGDAINPAHDHIQTELMVVVSGLVITTMNERRREYGPNDLLAIPADTPHETILKEGGLAQLTWTV